MTIASRLFIDNSAFDDARIYPVGINESARQNIFYFGVLLLVLFTTAFAAKAVLYFRIKNL